MEPIFKQQNTPLKATEVLFFPDAELQKSKGTSHSFAATGSLSVLYFKDYDRFILRLGDWKYPLMRRLPVTGLNKDEAHFRSYSLPAPNDFVYKLKINNSGSDVALENLETILQENSRFSWEGEDFNGKLEKSPNDKLERRKTGRKESISFKEKISEGFKHGVHAIRTKIETMKTKTKNINSRKKKVDLEKIKTRDFRREARSHFKKGFFESHEKILKEFVKGRRENINLILARSFEEMKKTKDSEAGVMYFPVEGIEDCILNLREVAKQARFSAENKPGDSSKLDEEIRKGIQEIKRSLGQRYFDRRPEERSRGRQEQQEAREVGLQQGLYHYEG